MQLGVLDSMSGEYSHFTLEVLKEVDWILRRNLDYIWPLEDLLLVFESRRFLITNPSWLTPPFSGLSFVSLIDKPVCFPLEDREQPVFNLSSCTHRALGLWGWLTYKSFPPVLLTNNAFVLISLTKCLSLTVQGYCFPHQLEKLWFFTSNPSFFKISSSTSPSS